MGIPTEVSCHLKLYNPCRLMLPPFEIGQIAPVRENRLVRVNLFSAVRSLGAVTI